MYVYILHCYFGSLAWVAVHVSSTLHAGGTRHNQNKYSPFFLLYAVSLVSPRHFYRSIL